MKELETFDDSHAKLSGIVDSSFNLGEPIPENKVVKKILRSLPKRFHAKVVAIEEHTNLDTLSIDELVGNLQTFEADHCSTKKLKGITLMSLKSVEGCSDDDTDCNSDDVEFEAIFVKKFKSFLKNKKGNLKNGFEKDKSKTVLKDLEQFSQEFRQAYPMLWMPRLRSHCF